MFTIHSMDNSEESSVTDEERQEFVKAVMADNIDKVQDMLHTGAADKLGEVAMTRALHIAVSQNQLEICNLLFDHGVDVNAEDKVGNTAAFGAQIETMEWLIQKGCNVAKQNEDGRTCLVYAIRNKNEQVIGQLLKTNIDINVADCDGNTPLHITCAITASNPAIVCMLLNAQCDIYTLNYDELTAFEMAVYADKFEYANLMLSAGFDVNSSVLIDDKGCGPILKVMEGTRRQESISIPKVRFLIECGSSVNKKNRMGSTSLHQAVHCPFSADFMKLLCSGGCKTNECDDHGDTALHLAMKAGSNPNIIQLLCQEKSDVNLQNNLGMTPLHMLKFIDVPPGNDVEKEREQSENVSVLLQYGANANIQDTFGCTSLFCVLEYFEGLEITKKLLDNGANTNIPDKCGISLIHFIANMTNFKGVFDLLLNYGMNINALDKYGSSALHYATWHREEDTVKILLEKGIDVHQRNIIGQTAADLARFFGIYDIANIITSWQRQYATNSSDFVEIHSADRKRRRIMDKDDMQNISEDSKHTLGKESKETGDEVSDTLNIRCHIEDLKVSSADKVTKELLNISDEVDTEQYLRRVLHSPMVGKLPLIKEVEDIKKHVWNLIEYLAQKVSEASPHLKFTPHLRGSVNEGTKCGCPDEFDFLCKLDVFTEICEVVESPQDPPGYSRVKLKSKTTNDFDYDEYFDEHGNLGNGISIFYFFYALEDILLQAETWQNTPLCYTTPIIIKPVALPFVVLWTGAIYKELSISIDIVPAIGMPSFWSETANPPEKLVPINSKLKGSEIVFCLEEHSLNTKKEKYSRVSYSLAEQTMFKEKISPDIKDGYILAKAMRSEYVCPPVNYQQNSKSDTKDPNPNSSNNSSDTGEIEAGSSVEEDGDMDVESDDNNVHYAADIIPSYWLKNALWLELAETDMTKSTEIDQKQTNDSDGVAISWARKIYARMEKCVQEGVLKSFFDARVNLLARTKTQDYVYADSINKGLSMGDGERFSDDQSLSSDNDTQMDLLSQEQEAERQIEEEDLQRQTIQKIFIRVINILLDNKIENFQN